MRWNCSLPMLQRTLRWTWLDDPGSMIAKRYKRSVPLVVWVVSALGRTHITSAGIQIEYTLTLWRISLMWILPKNDLRGQWFVLTQFNGMEVGIPQSAMHLWYFSLFDFFQKSLESTVVLFLGLYLFIVNTLHILYGNLFFLLHIHVSLFYLQNLFHIFHILSNKKKLNARFEFTIVWVIK